MIPKTLGACTDRLYRLREKRKQIEANADLIRGEERELEQHLIAELRKVNGTAISGITAKIAIKTKDVATAKNWQQIYDHIIATADFSLLQKRLSTTAIAEQWADGRVIPGVVPYPVTTVSITKL